MPLERRDIEESLVKKGFKRTEGDHSFFTYHALNGQKAGVWTKTSHGTKYKTLSDSLVSAMAKQCGVSVKEFRDLAACPLTQQQLEDSLIGSNRVTLSK